MPRLSFIIPTYQEEPFIERTLKQFSGLQISHELIVTDGGSTDKTLEIVKRYTDKVVVWDRAAKGRRQTFGEAKNMGAELATGEFFVFIDADVDIENPQKFFELALKEFEAKQKLVAVTVPLLPWKENKSIKDNIGAAPLNFFYMLTNNILRSPNGSGEFQMMRAEAFKKVHGYPEELAAGEDNEMMRKVGMVGQTRFLGYLNVRHSMRRMHKLGWLRTYGMWLYNGFSVSFSKKAGYKEWTVVR
jgi:glycosyltransferase involved in cell wall biosynthesis